VVVVVDGPDMITASGEYQWHALASGGQPPYHYQWYYRRGTTEQSVGGDSPWYSRTVSVEKRPYVFRLRNVVHDVAMATDQAVFWVDVVSGGNARQSLGVLDSRSACTTLPSARAQRQSAYSAILASGRWPTLCLLP
jgi:hypothetical protein